MPAGRPKGSKDKVGKQRKAGRWSESTRARLSVPAKSSGAAGGPSSGQDIREGWRAGRRDGGNSSAADVENTASAADEAEAEAADEAEADEAEAEAVDDEPEAAEPGIRAEAAERAARDGVEATEIDDDEGLRAVDGRDSVTMQYFRLVRARLQLEMSNRTAGLTDRWLLAQLKANDYWLRARDSLAVLRRLGGEIDGLAVEYVRDLRVWLPHVEFGIMPAHPVCGSAEHVFMHSWSHVNTWVARRVTALRVDYYVMTCRYFAYVNIIARVRRVSYFAHVSNY